MQTDGATRVIADLAVITNPGSAFEHRTDLNSGQDSAKVQSMLDTIKVRLESRANQKP